MKEIVIIQLKRNNRQKKKIKDFPYNQLKQMKME